MVRDRERGGPGVGECPTRPASTACASAERAPHRARGRVVGNDHDRAASDRTVETEPPPALQRPLAAPPSRGPRRALGRRLPWALVVVALAIGYWIGNNVGSAPAPASSKAAALVTPQQINQALAASSGAPTPVNDRGFSLLENGVQHSHGFQLPVSPSDQVLLDHQMALAEPTALKYPTLADARAAGMFRAGPFSPGLGTHMTMVADYPYAAGAGVMTDAQIEHPLSWIYDGTKPDSRVAGLFYQGSVPESRRIRRSERRVAPAPQHLHHHRCGGDQRAPRGRPRHYRRPVQRRRWPPDRWRPGRCSMCGPSPATRIPRASSPT